MRGGGGAGCEECNVLINKGSINKTLACFFVIYSQSFCF